VRTSKAEKEKTHERIVEIASRQIREQGLDGPAVAEVMEAAGLTHGGFYKHFGSRDDLIAEATEEALAASERQVHVLTDGVRDPLTAFVDWYLSGGHRDAPGAGCAVAVLGDDARRADERVRSAYGAQVERYVEHLERFLGGGEDGRQRAIVALSALVGAITLARAVDDEALVDEITTAVRAALRTA
jgi:TetR/AcrR family transcriptional repressor of nem operon